MKRVLNVFSFNGVASRKEWWLVYLVWWVFLMILAQLDQMVTGNSEDVSAVFMILFILSIWPLFATQIRRWHDRGKSGVWCFINMVPLIGHLWAFIELGFMPPVGTDPYMPKNPYR